MYPRDISPATVMTMLDGVVHQRYLPDRFPELFLCGFVYGTSVVMISDPVATPVTCIICAANLCRPPQGAR